MSVKSAKPALRPALLLEFLRFLSYRNTIKDGLDVVQLEFLEGLKKQRKPDIASIEKLARISFAQVSQMAFVNRADRTTLSEIHAALERAARRRGFRGASEFVTSHGRHGRLNRIRNALGTGGETACQPPTLASLADLLFLLDMNMADLAGPPAPWHDWPATAPIMICLGARQATTATGRTYAMIQKEDARAGMALERLFHKLNLGCDVTLLAPAEDDEDSAMACLDRVHSKGGAFIAVGSENANSMTAIVNARIPRNLLSSDDSVLSLGSRPTLTRKAIDGRAGLWSRTGTRDAGLLRVYRRKPSNDFPLVLATASGLGSWGTLAAVDALSAMHDVSDRLQEFNGDVYLGQGIVVPDTKVAPKTVDLSGNGLQVDSWWHWVDEE